MPLLTIIIVLIVVGFLLYLVNQYLPLDPKVKNIINIFRCSDTRYLATESCGGLVIPDGCDGIKKHKAPNIPA